ncbi:MAG: response regulator transcription factor [Myxococcota bacterium]
MGKPSILIVEDDENLGLALEDNLIDEGYDVALATDGSSARRELARGVHQLVILDIMLPDTDGYTLCREIREKGLPVRVLMLTARTLESDLVAGFDAGADDYIAKPYRLRELLARVGALLRRDAQADPEVADVMHFGRYALDVPARTLTRDDGVALNVTRTEFDLLTVLLRNAGRALSRDEILAAAWDPDVVVDPRTVDNFVSNLKKKLGHTKSDPYRILTVRGVGYRMDLGGGG